MEYTHPFREFKVKNFENEAREDYRVVPSVNVECVHSDPRYASIYKIDVGMSRAFDFGHSLMSNYKSEFIRRNPRLDVEPTIENIGEFTTGFTTGFLYNDIPVEDNVYFSEYVFTLMRARCPTVLHIKFVPDEQITVVRSTLKNTLIHQPRPNNIDYPTWMIEEFLAGDFRLNPDLQ
jgi:hypothetical protein